MLDELDKQNEKKQLPVYNPASLLSLNQGPISARTADALVSAGKAAAEEKNGQIHLRPVKQTPESTAPAVIPKTTFQAEKTAAKETAENRKTSGGDAFSTAKLLEGIARKGTTEAAHAMSSMLSLLEGAAFAPAEALTGFDDMQEQHGLFYKWNDAIERERKDAYRSSAANVAAGGTAAKIADTVGTAVVAAVPQAITALMSGGASVGTKGLEAAAAAAQRAPGVLNSLRSAASGLASNPNFWTSFLRTVGESYEQAKADGASDAKASAYAMGNGLLNAAAEVGGGLETLPKELQSGAPALKQWLRSAVQEGAEEPIQGVTERGLQNVVYGKKNPLFSVKDETAVFNPATAAKEFGVGAAVGGVLGGGQAAAGKAKNGLVPQARSAYSDSITGMEGTGNGGQGRNPGGTLRETAQAAARGHAGSSTEDGNRSGVQGAVYGNKGDIQQILSDIRQRYGGLGEKGAGNGGQGRNPGGTLRETAQAAARGHVGSSTEVGNRSGIQGENGIVLEAFRDIRQRHGGVSEKGAGNGGQGRNPGGALRETAQAATRGGYKTQTENGNRSKVQGRDGLGKRIGDLWKRHGGLSVAQDSRQSLSQYNANVHIIPEAEWNRSDSAFTRNAEVYMRETIPEENRGMIAPHEGTHVMKQAGYQPYLDFIERTPEMIDIGSKEGKELISEIARHRGIDPFNASEAELTTLYDELNATISGHLVSSNMPPYLYNGLKSAFYDFDAYAAELAAIHQGYINSRYRASAQRPILPTLRNATRAFAGTPHDYAALLAELARERGGAKTLTPEQRRELEAWNSAFPELRMSEEELLGR